MPLHEELRGAHALVTHGSIAAVEAVALGCPVFVDAESAAAVMGRTDISQIEKPIYPDNRMPWLHTLAYCQFTKMNSATGNAGSSWNEGRAARPPDHHSAPDADHFGVRRY